MYNNSDELVFKLNAVESTCAVEFYTVVDTSRSPVHNIPCLLHWVRDTVTDHCRNFALSDPNSAEFQALCRDHDNDLPCSKRLKQVGNLRVLPFDATLVEYEVTQCLFFKHSGNWCFYEIFPDISFLQKCFYL